MSTLTLTARSLADTDVIGQALSNCLPDGSVVSLNGTLGAGKTRLTQALAVGCGIPVDLVVSPTFVLCRSYQGRRSLTHIDAYRIHDNDEFIELGIDEYFESSDITLIEWGERVAECLPPSRLRVTIDILGDDARLFQFDSADPGFDAIAAALGSDCQHLVGPTTG